MASRGKISRLESEIEKCRVEGEWGKVTELVKQLSSKNPGLDYYTHFILGESIIEVYLQENPAVEQNLVSAKTALSEAERHLKIVLKENGKECRHPGMPYREYPKLTLEANLLLGKLYYYEGAYQSALNVIENAHLESVSIATSSARLVHIIAEAYAVKGLCLEKLSTSTTSKFKAQEKEEKILKCFEMAGDLAILCLQEKDKSGHSSGSLGSSLNIGSTAQPEADSSVGNLLETAIQQSPIYYIKHGHVDKGIKRFRDLLGAVESRFTQGLRLTLARQLAEVLLRGMCENNYHPPDPADFTKKEKENEMKPRKYSGDNLFIPKHSSEEALLLLLIAEALASREAVLNRSVEHTEARQHTFHNTTAVYDLLAIALVKRAQFNQLADSFEKAMKFSFEEYHIWHQWASALICARQYGRAVAVLRECHRLRPKSVISALQAAKVCYEHLHQYDEGIKYSNLALTCGEEHPMSARAYVALGVGYSLKAMDMKLQGDRQDYHRKALQSFQKAHILDPSDYLSLFHLALQLAVLRQIEDAVKYTKLALKYYSDHVHSLHLLVLLLTAQKQYQEAMDLINASLEEYPDNVSLLLTKSKIEEVVYGPETALNTCRNMMKLWKELQEVDSDETLEHTIDEDKWFSRIYRPIPIRKGLIEAGPKKQSLTATDRSQFDKKSQAHLMLSESTDRDGGSVRADSVAVSRIEQTLSDLTSTEYSGSYPQKGGSRQAWKLQSQIWMNLCELYLSLNRVKEAELCVVETAAIFPLSHQVAFMKARVYEHRQKYSDAKTCYENAISINPSHTKSLQHLGMVLHYLDNNKSAEKVLRDAVNADPTLNESWYCLGVVLEALGHSEAAAECQITALDLEATSPIVPFTVIPRLMQ